MKAINNTMVMAALMAGLPFSSLAHAGDATTSPSAASLRWPADKTWEWYNQQPWLVGCNFLPSTAVNDVEMWQAESFDAATIERELGWAHDLGFKTTAQSGCDKAPAPGPRRPDTLSNMALLAAFGPEDKHPSKPCPAENDRERIFFS